MFNIVQMLQASKNPQAIIQQIMNSSEVNNNPILKNAVGMAQKGDFGGVEKMVRNLSKEKGIDADEMFNQIKSQIGF